MMALLKKYPVKRMALIFLLNILDVALTYYTCLLNGNNDGEFNPLGRWLMNQGWGYAIVFKLAVIAVVLVSLGFCFKNDEKVAVWALHILIIIYSIVVIVNTISLGRSL